MLCSLGSRHSISSKSYSIAFCELGMSSSSYIAATDLHRKDFHPTLDLIATSGVDHIVNIWAHPRSPATLATNSSTGITAPLVNEYFPLFSTSMLHYAKVISIYWWIISLIVQPISLGTDMRWIQVNQRYINVPKCSFRRAWHHYEPCCRVDCMAMACLRSTLQESRSGMGVSTDCSSEFIILVPIDFQMFSSSIC